jgi:hypothetical protein
LWLGYGRHIRLGAPVLSFLELRGKGPKAVVSEKGVGNSAIVSGVTKVFGK